MLDVLIQQTAVPSAGSRTPAMATQRKAKPTNGALQQRLLPPGWQLQLMSQCNALQVIKPKRMRRNHGETMRKHEKPDTVVGSKGSGGCHHGDTQGSWVTIQPNLDHFDHICVGSKPVVAAILVCGVPGDCKRCGGQGRRQCCRCGMSLFGLGGACHITSRAALKFNAQDRSSRVQIACHLPIIIYHHISIIIISQT